VLDDVSEPQVREPTDAIVRLTASAICGTDLHFVRGTVPGMEPGTILGHEGVGIVEEVGPEVRNLRPGDRVVIPSTIACGTCSYCRAGYYSQCDRANPNGPHAGTAFYGGPQNTGPFDGMQAELVRVPFANVGPVKLPDEVSDDQAIMLSDIFPTGWFGARLAEIGKGDVVAVFGCGPVGQFAILSAMLQGAGRILAVDRVASRLDAAKRLGAEVVDFGIEDPVQTISELTLGIGVDRVIDAVGVDAEPASEDGRPGDAPQQALEWEVATVAKAGTIGIIGVYPQQLEQFPIGQAMNKNLTVKMGNCNHRRYLPELVTMVRSGAVDPSNVLTQVKEASAAIDAYQAFDRHEEGWIKVELEPQGDRERERGERPARARAKAGR
jgi:threonine dehydrogenase-like Zn-dependent dehydrogenase